MRRLLALLWLAISPLAHAEPGLLLTIAGPARPALPTSSACMPPDLPDAPARAVRLADGTVQLYASSEVNRVNTGPDLHHLRHDCAVVYRGAHADDPAAFDDRSWIASVWTENGKTILAILHNEFQGHRRPTLCPSGRYMDCWYNSISLAISSNSGRSFRRVGLVAALPYRFDQLSPGHHGYFNPTNIVRGNDNGLYMFAFATHAEAQEPGNCLLRTADPARPDAWRAWDGSGFTVHFIDPYRSNGMASDHVCTPVGHGALKWPVTSLVRHLGSGLFLAIMEDTVPNGGIYYATSRDLLHWSSPALLMPTKGPSGWRCEPPEPLFYPSLLDPQSPDRNFADVDEEAMLFATRFEATECKTLRSRTLMSWRVDIKITRH